MLKVLCAEQGIKTTFLPCFFIFTEPHQDGQQEFSFICQFSTWGDGLLIKYKMCVALNFMSLEFSVALL